jgi:hypothetical protein
MQIYSLKVVFLFRAISSVLSKKVSMFLLPSLKKGTVWQNLVLLHNIYIASVRTLEREVP